MDCKESDLQRSQDPDGGNKSKDHEELVNLRLLSPISLVRGISVKNPSLREAI